jgi:hypothetical protein
MADGSSSSEPKSSKPHIIIIGAGTGGLALAHGLLKHNLATVTVYERDRTRLDGLQGYRVGISPGGSAVLSYCLPEELYQTFVATCARTPRYAHVPPVSSQPICDSVGLNLSLSTTNLAEGGFF